MRKIAVYGKGGIGKSTTVQNLAAAFADRGARVLVLGCDPKADSTRLLLGRRARTTVLRALADCGDEVSTDDVVFSGYRGIRCVESGGPEPGVGCAGRGIITAISFLEERGVFDEGFDYVIYDVLGDVVCGGFALPIREGKADEIYIVCSGEVMSLFAANNIAKGISRYADVGRVRLGGLICNARNVDAELELVEELAARLGSQVIGAMPRSALFQEAELVRETVMAYAPASDIAERYRSLASSVEGNRLLSVPTPMGDDEFELMCDQLREHGFS